MHTCYGVLSQIQTCFTAQHTAVKGGCCNSLQVYFPIQHLDVPGPGHDADYPTLKGMTGSEQSYSVNLLAMKRSNSQQAETGAAGKGIP